MKSRHNRIFIVAASSLFIILFIISFPMAAKAQDKFLLQYKFKAGENLQYKTERQDSTESDMGGQANVREMTMWSLQTLSVEDVKKDVSYKITVKNDSMWTDMEPSMGQGMGMGRGSGGGRNHSMRGGGRDMSYEISPNGNSISKDPPIFPFLIPLPEKPIGANATWDFNIITEQKGRTQGQTTTTGECLLYDFQKVGDQTLAIIIVNSETKSEGKFEFRMEGRDPIKGTSASSGAATNLIYFNIDKGRIVEVVGEETRESVTESSMFSSDSSSKSKTTVKLVSE